MLELNAPQNVFINQLDTKYKAYVGGYGSGKTYIGCIDQLLFFSKHPATTQGYYAPTYPQIRDIFYPTFSEAAANLGFRVEIKESNKEIHVFRGRFYYGTVICRSMEHPQSIIGYKISRALVDEIDVLPKAKAVLVWNKIAARLRLMIDGVENSICVTSTPEGFGFIYSRFACDPTKSYSMVQASTYENEKYLPPSYITSLIETYPEELISAYIRGQFVNLKSGTVYNGYNRVKCRSNEKILPKEPLLIGMDFNVMNMSAVIFVVRGKVHHAVDELSGLYDTPSTIEAIQEKYPEHHISVFPDASGRSRKSVNAATSDIALLEQAGFSIYANKKNPFIKDRVMAANKAFQTGSFLINDVQCKETARCLEQLTYTPNGEPDKSSNNDHLTDACTYPISFLAPINKPMIDINVRF